MKELQARWNDLTFLAGAKPLLEALFMEKRPPFGADIRGLAVGVDGQPDGFGFLDFQNIDAEAFDASCARLSCSFSNSRFLRAKFTEALFDACYMKRTRFEQCDFSNSRLERPTLDDAVLTECTFRGSKFIGRQGEYGGRRVVFERCSFENTIFQSVSLRACRFNACTFAETSFLRSHLHGTRFSEGSPKIEAFTKCEGLTL